MPSIPRLPRLNVASSILSSYRLSEEAVAKVLLQHHWRRHIAHWFVIMSLKEPAHKILAKKTDRRKPNLCTLLNKGERAAHVLSWDSFRNHKCVNEYCCRAKECVMEFIYVSTCIKHMHCPTAVFRSDLKPTLHENDSRDFVPMEEFLENLLPL